MSGDADGTHAAPAGWRTIRRALLGTLSATAMLPVCLVVAIIVAALYVYGWRSEDPDALSPAVTFVGVLEAEGAASCRAFSSDDLTAHGDTLRLRFSLSASDLRACEETFRSYDAARGWPTPLTANERRFDGFRLEAEGVPPILELRVTRLHGNASAATTRYRVDARGRPFKIRTQQASNGYGVFIVVFGGGGGVVLWIIWLTRFLIGRRRRHRASFGAET